MGSAHSRVGGGLSTSVPSSNRTYGFPVYGSLLALPHCREWEQPLFSPITSTGYFITQSISVIGAASFSRIYFRQSLTWTEQLHHPLLDFAKAGLLRIIGVLSSQLLPAFTGTDIIATMSPSDFSHRIIPAFPSGWLYLPYLYWGRYETSLGHLTTLSSSSWP